MLRTSLNHPSLRIAPQATVVAELAEVTRFIALFCCENNLRSVQNTNIVRSGDRPYEALITHHH
ncbi:MAG: hypothetical protein ACNA7V_02855 [Bacteroidales bacterium]